MNHNDIASITAQDIRKVIIDFLQQRLSNNSTYKAETNKLAKAESDNDLVAINEVKQKLSEFEQRFELENWMEDALVKRISWLMVATHLSKGIHPSSKGNNVNYNTQKKSVPEYWVCSSTVEDLPYDATGSAAALDIFGLLNQKLSNGTRLLQLIIDEHPVLEAAFSDDKAKSAVYLSNFKKLLNDNWDNPTTSELNKQFYWPNSEQAYLSGKENQYRLLIPLHPSSLCHVVYQKVQQRFSDENKQAREQRNKKTAEQRHYFSFHDLAVVRLGGSNAQNASQLIGSQMGRNYLLPSIPPILQKIGFGRSFKLTKRQSTIFSSTLQLYCRAGFNSLYRVILADRNIKVIREQRKDAFGDILATVLKLAQNIQSAYPAGWSRDYQLDMNQKYWLDPCRADLDGEEEFSYQYHNSDWITELEKQFAYWINAILKDRFKNIANHFDDAELTEWRREFSMAVKASQRNKEGIF